VTWNQEDHSWTVDGPDGIDTLRNIEALYFSGDKVTRDLDGADTSAGPPAWRTGGGLFENPEIRTVTLDNDVADHTLTPNDFYLSVWGNDLKNRLIGNDFDNSLNGLGGVDTLEGGGGNDVYRIDQPDDLVIETDGGGIDLVYSNVGYELAAFVENLTLLDGGPDVDGTGNDLANVITGNSSANDIYGRGGNDTLIGGGGNDNLVGGTGNDYYVVDDAGDVVAELAGEGNDTVSVSFSYSIAGDANLENIVLTGSAALSAAGNDGNNTLVGNAAANQLSGGAGSDGLYGGLGDDVLDGGFGADWMVGGSGNDTYYVDNAGDWAAEDFQGGAADQVYTTISHTLAAYVENLYASGSSAINLTGNSLNNTITGNTGRNTLKAGSGNDFINGGYGKDTLYGSTGNDTFVFDTKLSKTGNVDKIADYNVKYDTVWLDNAIFTKLGKGSASAPKKLSKSYFEVGKADDRNDYITYDKSKGYLYYDADGSGTKYKAVLVATLSKNLKMTYSDFYVV
jgi:Ca2+-binding RTX toxin-like protein